MPNRATPKKPASKKGRRAARVSPTKRSPRLRFALADLRRPLEHLDQTTGYEKDQMQTFIGKQSVESAVFDPAWHPTELLDVVVGGAIKYQLFLHPLGGHLFAHGTTTMVAGRSRHWASSKWAGLRETSALYRAVAAAVELTRARPTYIDKPTEPVASRTPSAAKATESSGTHPSVGLRLSNYRLPLERIDRTTPEERSQIEAIVAKAQMGPLEEAARNHEIHPFELVDVIHVVTGHVRFQVYLWPPGSGVIFENASTKTVASIRHHRWEQHPLDEGLRAQFAAAWNEAKALGIHQTVRWK